MTIQKKVFDFFLFSSLFIAVVAVVMVYHTYTLLIQQPTNPFFLAFVFFSTVSSYNFHWLLTPHSVNPSFRLSWSYNHKGYHLFLFISGSCLAIYLFFYLINDWFWIGIAALLTFLYSAPKISLAPFQWLKRFAIGKTIFLAMVWTYVTSVLPLIVENVSWSEKSILFCVGEFFFIYSICILFDYRDRQDDIADGIRSMITYFNEKGITILFIVSVLTSTTLFFLLTRLGIPWLNFILLLIPLLIVSMLFNHTKKSFSDYLFYFVLDGLMMLSGLLLWIMNRF